MNKFIYWSISVVFALLILAPLFWITGTSIFQLGTWQWLSNASIWINIFNSFWVAALTATLSSLAGIVIAFLMARIQIRGKQSLTIILLIPLLISPYIQAVAWKDAMFLFFGRNQLIFSPLGVVFVHSLIFTPLCFLILSNAFQNINSRLEDAARIITSHKKVILHITLPLLKPAIMVAWVLSFIFSIADFSVPAFFGVKSLTTEIFTQFAAFYNHKLAISQSLFLVLLCLFLLLTKANYLKKSPFFSIGNRGSNTSRLQVGRWSMLISLGLWAYALIAFLVPLLVLSIRGTLSEKSYWTEALNLILPVIGDSLWLAMLTALITVFAACIWAVGSTRWKLPALDIWLLICFAIPSTVLGISFIKFYNQPALQWIYGSSVLLSMGLVAKFAFLAAKLFENSLIQIPYSFEEAAKMAGATPWQRWRYILFPLLTDAAFTAFTLVFILSLGDLGYTIMVYPPGSSLMPIKIFTIMANAPEALTSSMILIALVVSLASLGTLYGLRVAFIRKHWKL